MSVVLAGVAVWGAWRGWQRRQVALWWAAAAGVSFGIRHYDIAALQAGVAWLTWNAALVRRAVAMPLERLWRTARKLRHYDIDWRGFATTRGSFTGWRIVTEDRRTILAKIIGLRQPYLTTSSGEIIPVEWDPWAPWPGPDAPLVVRPASIARTFAEFGNLASLPPLPARFGRINLPDIFDA